MNPAELTTYDWVHTMMQGGVLIDEMTAMFQVAGHLGVTRAATQAFLKDADWCFTRSGGQKSRALHRIFDEKRKMTTDPDKVRCSCSEALGVYGLLRLTHVISLGPLSCLSRE